MKHEVTADSLSHEVEELVITMLKTKFNKNLYRILNWKLNKVVAQDLDKRIAITIWNFKPCKCKQNMATIVDIYCDRQVKKLQDSLDECRRTSKVIPFHLLLSISFFTDCYGCIYHKVT